MIQLLSTVVLAEGTVAFLLMINIPPFRKLLMKALDKALSNKGPAMIMTLAVAMAVILGSSLFSITKIQARNMKVGAVTPTDQILLKTHMLEASLMGYSLFLGLVIYRLHHFLRKIRLLKKEVESLKGQMNDELGIPRDERKESGGIVSANFKPEITGLRKKVQKLTADCHAMENQAKLAEGDAKDIQKQTEALVLDASKILEDNLNLRQQLATKDSVSRTENKEKDV